MIDNEKIGEIRGFLGKVKQDPQIKGLVFDSGKSGFLSLEGAESVSSLAGLEEGGVCPEFETIDLLPVKDCLIELTGRNLFDLLPKNFLQAAETRALSREAHRLVTLIRLGQGRSGLLGRLYRLAGQLKKSKAPGGWPLWSSLTHFPDEWQRHCQDQGKRDCACQRTLSAPCRAECPAGIDIPGFISLTGQGRYQEAAALIRRDNPLPYISGLICPAPCQEACLRKGQDGPIGIKAMKAAAARLALGQGGYPRPEKASPSGQKAAVIGSGPAGLTAAYFLALKGHEVTIFEAQPVIGGNLYLAIPAFRLPREVIETEVKAIEEAGVVIKKEQALGKDFTLEDLRRQGYSAVFLGIGARSGLKLGIPGETDFPQVFDALSFLGQVALGRKNKMADQVVVVGGGNAAMDAARTCLRLGCRRVSVLYRRTRVEMPAHQEEIDQALEEGVDIRFLVIPKEIIGRDNQVEGLICLKAELGPDEAPGRRRPAAIPGSEFFLEAGAVISAIGQVPDLSCLGRWGQEGNMGRETILVNPENGRTRQPWLFSGGDAVSGPATVAAAVAGAKKAALAMDAYLREVPQKTTGLFSPSRKKEDSPPFHQGKRSGWGRPDRSEDGRKKQDIRPGEMGLTGERAREEAGRCRRCDICIGCGLCQEVCREIGVGALVFKETRGERLVYYDLDPPSERCIGCGACALVCPTGAIRTENRNGRRDIFFAGALMASHPLLVCSQCGEGYFPPAQMDLLREQLKSFPMEHLDLGICPQCARPYRARALTGHIGA